MNNDMPKPYYSDGQITIYNADNREILSLLPLSSIDLVITSPPYNLGEGMEDHGGFRIGHSGSKWANPQRDSETSIGYKSYNDNLPYPEYVEWQKAILLECWRVLSDNGAIYYNHKPRIVKGQLRIPTALNPNLPLRQIIIWNRKSGFNYTSGAYMPVCEWILILAKEQFKLRDKASSGVGDVWTIPPEKNSPHPAPFPLQLPKKIISTTNAETVLDPFMGSGTTLCAARDAGIKAIGIEVEEKYCEIAANRLRQKAFSFIGI